MKCKLDKKEVESLWKELKEINVYDYECFVNILSNYIDVGEEKRILMVTLYDQSNLLFTLKTIGYNYDNDWLEELVEELDEFKQIQLTESELTLLLKIIPKQFSEPREYLQKAGDNLFWNKYKNGVKE